MEVVYIVDSAVNAAAHVPRISRSAKKCATFANPQRNAAHLNELCEAAVGFVVNVRQLERRVDTDDRLLFVRDLSEGRHPANCLARDADLLGGSGCRERER